MSYSEKAYQASAKYRKAKIKRVPLDMQITAFEELRAHAERQGETVNGFIKRAIAETMVKDRDAAL